MAPTLSLVGPNTAHTGHTKHYTFTTYDPGVDTFAFAAGSPSCGGSALSNASIDPGTGAGSFDCTFPNDSAPASYIVSVQVQDSDAVSSNTDSIIVDVTDATPPDTSITGGPADASLSNDRNSSFTFTGQDNVTTTGNLTYE